MGKEILLTDVMALRGREQIKAFLQNREERATLLEQLVTYFLVNVPNVLQNQQFLQLRQASSMARHEVITQVK